MPATWDNVARSAKELKTLWAVFLEKRACRVGLAILHVHSSYNPLGAI